MSQSLHEILERLNRLPELARIADIIETVRAVYDVDHVSYYAISLGLDAREHADPAITPLPDVDGVMIQTGRKFGAMSFSLEWLQWYMQARYFDSDPVVLGAAASFEPVDWSELDWDGKERANFRSGAEELGVGTQGYTVPVRGPGGQMALFTLNKSCETETWQRLLTEFRTDFLLLAHFVHQRILQLAGIEHAHPTRPLSSREREVMRLIAAGMSRSRASEKLGISENTFRVYVDSARHKLGALNLPHAVALAAHRGIIPPT